MPHDPRTAEEGAERLLEHERHAAEAPVAAEAQPAAPARGFHGMAALAERVGIAEGAADAHAEVARQLRRGDARPVAQQPRDEVEPVLRAGEELRVDLLHWSDEAAARAAMAAAGASEACRAYFACMTGVDHADPGAGLLLLRRVRAFHAR